MDDKESSGDGFGMDLEKMEVLLAGLSVTELIVTDAASLLMKEESEVGVVETEETMVLLPSLIRPAARITRPKVDDAILHKPSNTDSTVNDVKIERLHVSNPGTISVSVQASTKTTDDDLDELLGMSTPPSNPPNPSNPSSTPSTNQPQTTDPESWLDDLLQ